MTEHPIIFSGPMVRAILAGRKTQTRRVVKPQPDARLGADYVDGVWYEQDGYGDSWPIRCPYGVPGDRLWVRETWRPWPHPDMWDGIMYRADGAFVKPDGLSEAQGHWLSTECEHIEERWRPSIHMPRWASRLTPAVADVRVERVQDISECDSIAEGVGYGWQMNSGWPDYLNVTNGVCELTQDTARQSFATLWDSINAKRGYPWAANPWVWAVTFEPEPAP